MSTNTRRHERGAFRCIHCKSHVNPDPYGSDHRNHCPYCLWSRHVDDEIGDRRSPCAQGMEPIAVSSRGDGEWTLIHKCTGCGQLRVNRIAGDDDELALLALAIRPISDPAFPLDRLPGR